ncbi:alanyl-tRNA synthetase [Verticillium alfalfae VaMs.102]|uniref:Alanine--tRNA ligase n=1 Tax=Verticillium alfalfae (strain VaMs.102 / ATCC MYA-4576 / FGSC 10136) TaxID=526221 RepID=C9SH01_VERA1|nr:alanyl-tRNA synthetase [Verticillium alfalfae VaMs.102]EEY17595.1 alanyl-tRNA synthetase [Verticillium alfalfae VaMs.102]
MAEEQKWPAAKVRETFIKFFEERGHTVVPSSSVVPHNDPTLLFTNAGMNQFKSIFLGTIAQSDPTYGLKRATDTQKGMSSCPTAANRASELTVWCSYSCRWQGHSFFEMLGNWSFGPQDYFKKDAIKYSWEFMTETLGLEKDRLYVTYFEGDPAQGLEPDLESKELWKSVGVPESHILPGSKADNWWSMGDTGPCGPCSELHYDKIGGRDAAHLVNKDDPMVVELWNNVWMAYDRRADQSLTPLPAQHVDTGMGFERLVAALQDVSSNYATDIWSPYFKKIQEVTGTRAYTDKYGAEDPETIDTAYRACADHIRMLGFAIADGAVPNNEGRGYVVRRVLRRGARYARKYLNAEIGTFFSRVLPTLIDEMGQQFPELVKKQNDIKEILDEEEEAFAKTLDRGEAQFQKFAGAAEKKGLKKLSGAEVWKLYDTYGFPVDLTQLMAEERGLQIDDEEVKAAQEKAREASKSVKSAIETFPKLDVHGIAELEQQHKVARTNDADKYVKGDSKGKVQLIFDGKGFVKSTKDIAENTPISVILDKTNFYAEAGGQGYGGYILHHGYIESGTLFVRRRGYLRVRRAAPIPHQEQSHGHSHSEPRPARGAGEDVNQKGSLDLLENPKKPEWRNISVEFCGGTHVEQTGHIKDLVIVEESGIAKGIRRIIAFTGDAAHQVQREATELSRQLDIVEALPYSPEKEKEVKEVQQALSKATISTLTKDELKKKLDKMVKAITDEQKKRQKAEAKTALDTVQKYFTENPDAKAYVGQLPISANTKALTETIKHYSTKDKERSVYLFGGGKEENAVVHGVYVGTHLASKGVTAEAWASTVSDVVGGKSGGKEPTRQGQGTKPEATDDGVKAATKWLEEKLKL